MIESRVSSFRLKVYGGLALLAVVALVVTVNFGRQRYGWDTIDDLEDLEDGDAPKAEAKETYTSSKFKTDYIFHSLNDVLHTEDGKRNATKVKVVITVVVARNAEKKMWVMDLSSDEPSCYAPPTNEGIKSDCKATITDDDLIKVATGKLHIQSAFLAGKMKIYGNILRAAKIKDLLYMALYQDYQKKMELYQQSLAARKAANDAKKQDKVEALLKADAEGAAEENAAAAPNTEQPAANE